jgi:hypothetical protein
MPGKTGANKNKKLPQLRLSQRECLNYFLKASEGFYVQFWDYIETAKDLKLFERLIDHKLK